jgi:hypothetical protein
MFLRLVVLSFLILVLGSPAVAASDDAPAWLQQAAALKVPAYDKDVPAIVLLNRRQISVTQDGRISGVTTFAIRILLHEGRDYAIAQQFYESDAGKVRDMHAWLIRPSGQVKRYGKDETLDAIEDSNDVYNESRFKMIDASKDADAGAVFGYQITTEERSVFSQDLFSFQSNRLPTLASSYNLTLPQGWRAISVTFNHEGIEPVVSLSNYTWEMRDIGPIRVEPGSPRVSSLAPRLAVSFFPPADAQSTSLQTYANWAEVSRWVSSLHETQWAADTAITGKVRELTAGAKTELEKIRAIARYVQSIRYISIQIGVSRGGGMRPHTAAEVFAKSYGDCKDKANLMRAMLKVLDIPAYPVAIYSGDPGYVREEWASPFQFNHCIIAIKVSDETQAAAVVTHSKLGRLLIFDATDDDTLLGDLPEHEQGSFALILAGEAGTLMRMPVMPSQANGYERQIEATLAADGSLSARIHEKSLGSWASDYRSTFRHVSPQAYMKIIEGWISSGATAAKISNVDPQDNSIDGRFDLSIDFSATNYGQLMQNRLLVFKPTIVSRREALTLTEAKRMYPVVLQAHAYTEILHLKLPAGFDVDELPDAVKLETAFGSYQTTYDVKNGELIFTRTLAQRAGSIPVDQYPVVRNFFERIRAAEQSPVVLARK